MDETAHHAALAQNASFAVYRTIIQSVHSILFKLLVFILRRTYFRFRLVAVVAWVYSLTYLLTRFRSFGSISAASSRAIERHTLRWFGVATRSGSSIQTTHWTDHPARYSPHKYHTDASHACSSKRWHVAIKRVRRSSRFVLFDKTHTSVAYVSLRSSCANSG